MAIHENLDAFRVRADVEPTYIHVVCKRSLREYPGRPTTDSDWFLKCDDCNEVIGQWSTKDQMDMELRAWSQIMLDRDPSTKRKQRFSVGRRVMVGAGKRVGTVASVADAPSVLGEFAHEVLMDGETRVITTLGCDLEAVPHLDEDLRANHPVINIQNSHVANLNVGSQIGTINAALNFMESGDDAQRQLALALKEFTESVVSSNTILPDPDKREVVQALSTVAEQAKRKPEERSTGTLKAALAWIPTAISAASNLVILWDKLVPAIKAYFGF